MRFYFSRSEQVVVAVLLLAILGALVTLTYAFGHRVRETPLPPLLETHAATATPAKRPNAIPAPPDNLLVVHVTGAVLRPGVYTFTPGARIFQAVRQAGGARADGFADALNLAERLQDGEKIYLPTRTEWQRMTAAQPPPVLVTRTTTSTSAPAATTATHPTTAQARMVSAPKADPAKPINLNTATIAELQQIRGIGPVTAQHIIDYRTAHGKFTDLAELLNVAKIGPKTLEKISPFLTL